MDNLGKITFLRGESQELESERPLTPIERASAVGRGSAPAEREGHSNSRASELGLDPELLDAHRDNDHAMTWDSADWADRAMIIALLVSTLAIGAIVLLAWQPWA